MLTTEQIDRLLNQGANVLSEDGEKIGSIGQVFVDNDNGQPSWVTVRTGLLGMSESFVPLEGARVEGDDLVVPYTKNQVKDAPRIDADRPLESAEEDRLYQHYQIDSGRTYSEATTDRADVTAAPDATRPATQRDTSGAPGYGTTAPAAADATTPATQRDTSGAPGYGTTAPAAADATTPATQRDTSGAPGYGTTATGTTTPTDATTPATQRDTSGAPGYGTAATPHASTPAQRDTTAPAADAQPRPDRGTQQPATGQGRLRKYVTTENVTRTVPVQREEVRIEREPITEENRSEVSDRADDENEVILHEERIIVTKETVPVERVHIGTETVTDEVTIKEKVRKEHFGTEGSEGTEGTEEGRG